MNRRRKAYEPSTLKNYHSAQKLFLRFCLVYGIDISFLAELDLAAYAEWLIQGALSCATVQNHLAAVKMFYQWWGKTDVVGSMVSPAWDLTIKGLNTIRPSFDKRAALTIEHLAQLVDVCLDDLSLAPLRVALTFGFFGFLRISNLAPPTTLGFDAARHTSFGDSLFNQGLMLNIKWSKTRQNAKHTISIPLPALTVSDLCPVRAWNSYVTKLNDCDIKVNTPLLVTTKPKGRPITIPSLRKMFHKACYEAHLEGAGYTPHSLRRGGATTAYHAGVSIDSIKFHGTWRSEAVQDYLFSQPIFSTPVAHTFTKLLNDYSFN